MQVSSETLHSQLLDLTSPVDDSVKIKIGEMILEIHSNSFGLIHTFKSYFSHYITSSFRDGLKLMVIEYPEFSLKDYEFGELEGHDNIEYSQLDEGMVYRVKDSGMIFLQNESSLLAVGPCELYPQQIIEYISSFYEQKLLEDDWILCRCNAVEILGCGIAIVGDSENSVNLLALELLNHEDTRLLSSKKTLLKNEGVILARGVPVQPVISADAVQWSEFLQSRLSTSNDTEVSVYSVDIPSVYGLGKIITETALCYIVILNWSEQSDEPVKISSLDLKSRHELHEKIKSQMTPFISSGGSQSKGSALDHFVEIEAFEVTGAKDLDKVKEFLIDMASNS